MTTDLTAPTLPLDCLAHWGDLPAGMTLVETPGVSVAADDTVYLLTRNPANPVIVLDAGGAFQRTFGAGTFTNRTHAILAAGDGFIYCADDGAHTITKWTPGGELLLTIGRPHEPAPRFSGEPFNRPTDIAIAEDGAIFISDGYGNARVHKYSPSGEHLLSWGAPGIDPGQFLCPHNIALRGDRVYVADREAHRVQIFDLDGGLVTIWNNIHRPCGLSVGPDGHIYIGELNGVELMEGRSASGTASAPTTRRARCWAATATPRRAASRAGSSRRTRSPSIRAATCMWARSRTRSGAATSIRRGNCPA